jgi:hypothetical protein
MAQACGVQWVVSSDAHGVVLSSLPASQAPALNCVAALQVDSTRKKMDFAFNNVCGLENTKRLDKLVQLRSQARGGGAGGCQRSTWPSQHA